MFSNLSPKIIKIVVRIVLLPLLVAGCIVVSFVAFPSGNEKDTVTSTEYMEDTESTEDTENTEGTENTEKTETAEEAGTVGLTEPETETQPQSVGEDLASSFYKTEITDEIFSRMNGVSYQENDEIAREDLNYLKVLYTGFDGETHEGELIVNQEIADDVLEIMWKLYQAHYPIERMVLVDEYGADDEKSMEDNNTSGFNFRTIAGSDRLSNHSYGMAVDINPRYNPYVWTSADGETVCSPENGAAYADRAKDFPYKIDENDLCYRLFTEHGFTWGGSWTNRKDYQHFEKTLKD